MVARQAAHFGRCASNFALKVIRFANFLHGLGASACMREIVSREVAVCFDLRFCRQYRRDDCRTVEAVKLPT